MNTHLEQALTRLEFGDVQQSGSVVIIPLFTAGNKGPDYITLREAMAAELLTVREISEAGSVPELRVENTADVPVLIVDGEEFRGAKQNRVVNTSILLAANSTATIPVSCTERGRWAYRNHRFEDSSLVMAREARAAKVRSVSSSLEYARSFRSDQGRVWKEVDSLHSKLGVRSGTGAMRDSYETHRQRLHEWQSAFPCLSGQSGFIAFANGAAAGMDLLSRPGAYAQLHERLVKSYLIDLLGPSETKEYSICTHDARNFINDLRSLYECAYPAVALGEDLRYEGNEICGSALMYESVAIHTAFFRTEGHSARREFR